MNKPLPKLAQSSGPLHRDPNQHADHVNCYLHHKAEQAKQAKRYAKHPFAICLDAGKVA